MDSLYIYIYIYLFIAPQNAFTLSHSIKNNPRNKNRLEMLTFACVCELQIVMMNKKECNFRDLILVRAKKPMSTLIIIMSFTECQLKLEITRLANSIVVCAGVLCVCVCNCCSVSHQLHTHITRRRLFIRRVLYCMPRNLVCAHTATATETRCIQLRRAHSH